MPAAVHELAVDAAGPPMWWLDQGADAEAGAIHFRRASEGSCSNMHVSGARQQGNTPPTSGQLVKPYLLLADTVHMFVCIACWALSPRGLLTDAKATRCSIEQHRQLAS